MTDTTFVAKQTSIKAEWCNEVNTLVHKVFGNPTTTTQSFYLTDGQVNIGDYGLEESGVNVNGTTYATKLRINDIGGNNPAQLVLHRHSPTWASIIVGSRSNSSDSSHGVITNGMGTLYIYGTGWTGSHYDLFASIEMSADASGTISSTSSPGRIILKTAKNGSNVLTTALTIDSSQNITLNHATEDLKFVDSGSTGATEQDWVEVTVGGNTGYLRVYASK